MFLNFLVLKFIRKKMSRSIRKTPIYGMTNCKSEKKIKKFGIHAGVAMSELLSVKFLYLN
jgi:hypothetical protein